ncbi:MAG: hypothetical protein HC875_08305 [Anaerolineales bacterium]|nr:hypothetical protein [Anaerolineales bacterium]
MNKLIQKLDERWRCYKEAYSSAVTTRSERHHQYHNHEDAEHPHEHEVFRVAPKVLLDDVEKVVEAVVKVKLFIIKDAQPKSLLECVQYWGREDTVSASKDIKDVLSELEDDDLLKLPPARAVSQPKIPMVNLSAAPNDSFQKLLDYIRTQREKRGKQLESEGKGGRVADGVTEEQRKHQDDQLESEEWEDILNLELSSEVGHKQGETGCLKHYAWVEVYHIHGFDGNARLCSSC